MQQNATEGFVSPKCFDSLWVCKLQYIDGKLNYFASIVAVSVHLKKSSLDRRTREVPNGECGIIFAYIYDVAKNIKNQ